MRIFLLKSILMIAFCHILGWGIFILLNKRAIASSEEKISWVFSLRHQNYGLAILGPSAVFRMADPSILSRKMGVSAINLGATGLSYGDQWATLHRYISNNEPPKILLLHYHAFNLSKPPIFQLMHNEYLFLPYLDDTAIANYVQANKPALDFFLWKYAPITRLIQFNQQYSFINVSSKRDSFDKYQGYEPSQIGQYKESVKPYFVDWVNQGLMTKKDGKYSASLDERNLNYLTQIITLCTQKNIKVVFFTAPEFIDFESQLDTKKQDDFFAHYCKNHQVDWMDFRSSDICRKKILFYDEMHLNSDGAKEFSALLGNRLKTLPANVPR